MKYRTAIEIAQLALSDLRKRGERFLAGTAREAALAAAKTADDRSAAAAIQRVFLANRISVNPRWDGSIA